MTDSLFTSRDLEWEVTHKKSSVHKGRGSTPEAALRDLRDSFALGVKAATEDVEREQKRLDKLTEMLDATEPGMPLHGFQVWDSRHGSLIREFDTRAEAEAFTTHYLAHHLGDSRDLLVVEEEVL